MYELALFAGAGGGILGGKLLGWRTVCAVEINAYARKVLLARQRDGILPKFPIWDDVQTFDGKPWRGKVDVISGGFPCQDISVAGKGTGITGKRSGLWSEMARIIGEVRPQFVFVENSPMLITRGLTRVLSDLAKMGYDAKWGIVGARHVGAPHKRDRIWILAYSQLQQRSQAVCNRCEESFARHPKRVRSQSSSEVAGCGSVLANSDSEREQQPKGTECEVRRRACDGCKTEQHKTFKCGSWWESEPAVGRVANGVAHRVDRLRAIGNGQVPAVAARAWEILNENNNDS
ncbi:MAG: DNA cytosine methyltransferase [Verrucomicrobiota bacterium]